MLIILIGHTCSGTSYLLEKINKDKKIEQILEFTDRPKRFNEEKGYLFVNQEEFKKEEMLCKIEYLTKDEKQPIYSYGISKNITKLDYKNNNYIIRTNIELLNELVKFLNKEEYLIINLYVSNIKELMKRVRTRENLEETKRRFESDIKKLNLFHLKNKDSKNYKKLKSDSQSLNKIYKRCGINVQ